MSKISKRKKSSKDVGKNPEIRKAKIEEPYIRGLPPDLKEHLLKLRRHESSILKKLEKDPQMADLFLRDPGGALVKMGIAVDPLLRKRARLEGLDDLLAPRKFCLPNGQTITPKISIRFVSHKREKPNAGK